MLLLKEEGFIFVSIDDNEVAQLMILMNDVFEENFISNLVWLNKEGGGSSDSKHFRIKREFILCYGKSKELAEISPMKDIKGLNMWRNEESTIFKNLVWVQYYFKVLTSNNSA